MAILTGNQATTRNPGVIRVATNAEASAGSNVVAAITPPQLKAAVDAGIGTLVGGLIYKGLFDPTTGVPNPVEAQAKQGWFYKVSQSGTWLGLTLNVGDNIYFNADVLPSDAEDVPSLLSKIDIIDNTESIMNLEDLHNVTSTDIVGGQGLVYNEELGEWVNQDIVYNLDDLDDVTLSETIANGQGLVYDAATEQWTNQDIVEVLDDLSDVYYDSITSSEYSNSTAVATLTINKDHILEFTAGTTGTRRILIL